MTKPRATLRCVANTYVGPDERVIEISGKNGGCLIALLNCTDGTLLVSVYRCDKTVLVSAPAENIVAEGGSSSDEQLLRLLGEQLGPASAESLIETLDGAGFRFTRT